jgi:hypothetical protein
MTVIASLLFPETATIARGDVERNNQVAIIQISSQY